MYLDNPVFSTEDFVRMLAIKFDIEKDGAISKPVFLTRFEAMLRDRRDRGEITALVVDEAQSLSIALLEELRLLANIETSAGKLLPLVLAGQPELALRLESPELRQLKQRITLRCELAAFELSETAGYIAKRIEIVGGLATRLFTQGAVILVHEYSRGLPRMINVICDNSLLCAMALGQPRVDETMVIEVCRDLKLKSRPGSRLAARFVISASKPWNNCRTRRAITAPVARRIVPVAQVVPFCGSTRRVPPMKRVDKALQVWEDSASTRQSRDESRQTLLNQYAPEGLAHEPPKRRLGIPSARRR